MCESHIFFAILRTAKIITVRAMAEFKFIFSKMIKIIIFFFFGKFDGRLMGVVVYSKFIQNQILLFYNFSGGNIYDVFLLFSHFFRFVFSFN